MAESLYDLGKSLEATPDTPDTPAAPQSLLDIGKDIGRSAVAGIPKGLAGGIGMPGDIQSAATSDYNPFNWLTSAIEPHLPKGWTEHSQKLAEHYGQRGDVAGETPLPTSQQTRSAMESGAEKLYQPYAAPGEASLPGGKFYEPQTPYGKVAGATTEFMANPWSYTGTGGAGLKAATAGFAGLGSEAAAQSVGDDSWAAEPLRIAGALAAGKIPQRVAMARYNSIIRNAPSTDALFDSADKLYDASRSWGVMFKPNVLNDVISQSENELRREAFHPSLHPQVWKAMEAVRELQNNQGLVGMKEMQLARRLMQRVANTKNPDLAAEREASRYVISNINKYLTSFPLSDIKYGDMPSIKSAVNQWRLADKAYSVGMRSEQLEDAFMNAELGAGSTGKGGNIENKTRQALASILRSKVKQRGFTDDEIETMKSIAKGDFKTNALRLLGSAAPTGIVSGTLGLELGHLLFHSGTGTVGLPLASFVSKKLGERMTDKRIQEMLGRLRIRGTDQPIPIRPPSMPKGSLSTLAEE